jgi:hypothetical protein
MRDPFGYRESVFGIGSRGLQYLFEREFAEALLCTACQPHTAPGTVTAKMPAGGIPDMGPQFFGSHW